MLLPVCPRVPVRGLAVDIRNRLWLSRRVCQQALPLQVTEARAGRGQDLGEDRSRDQISPETTWRALLLTPPQTLAPPLPALLWGAPPSPESSRDLLQRQFAGGLNPDSSPADREQEREGPPVALGPVKQEVENTRGFPAVGMAFGFRGPPKK